MDGAAATSEPKQFRPTTSRFGTALVASVAYICLAILLVAYLPEEVFEPGSEVFFLTIGLVAVWRYSWWAVHLFRGALYRRIIFPQLRHKADAIHRNGVRPSRVFALVTSYRIAPEITYAVYDALVKNALDYGVPTVIVASLSDRTDVDVLSHVLADNGHPEGVELRYMFQRGDGKRSAMAEALRTIARCEPGPDDLVVFMDGDIRIPVGTLRRTAPFFFLEKDVGAVTTDNRGIVHGSDATKEWYDLRYAQRHMLMSSMSLSRRVLVLTGRYSIIRAPLCTAPDFIAMIERDQLNHRRFGTFQFLSGDDKSSWFYLLKQGWAMRYIPDVQVHGFEELPDRNRFFSSTLALMRRWYGNMLRTSDRAIALGPRPMGLFTWWCLVDQRLSIWTTLIGPIAAVSIAIFIRPSFLLAYILWVMGTRLLASLLLGTVRGRFSPFWPFLLYYNQIFGAFLKSFVAFRYNRQKWTRQGISAGESDNPRLARYVRLESALLHTAAVLLLITAVTLAAGVLKIPGGYALAGLTSSDAAADDFWVERALERLPTGGVLLLPEERVQLRDVAVWSTRAAGIAGAGPGKTVLSVPGLDASGVGQRGDGADTPIDGRLVCGSGERACQLANGLELRNLTLEIPTKDGHAS